MRRGFGCESYFNADLQRVKQQVYFFIPKAAGSLAELSVNALIDLFIFLKKNRAKIPEFLDFLGDQAHKQYECKTCYS